MSEYRKNPKRNQKNYLSIVSILRPSVFSNIFVFEGNPDILICGNCRELFNDIVDMLEHKKIYCKMRFTCKCDQNQHADAPSKCGQKEPDTSSPTNNKGKRFTINCVQFRQKTRFSRRKPNIAHNIYSSHLSEVTL